MMSGRKFDSVLGGAVSTNNVTETEVEKNMSAKIQRDKDQLEQLILKLTLNNVTE